MSFNISYMKRSLAPKIKLRLKIKSEKAKAVMRFTILKASMNALPLKDLRP